MGKIIMMETNTPILQIITIAIIIADLIILIMVIKRWNDQKTIKPKLNDTEDGWKGYGFTVEDFKSPLREPPTRTYLTEEEKREIELTYQRKAKKLFDSFLHKYNTRS